MEHLVNQATTPWGMASINKSYTPKSHQSIYMCLNLIRWLRHSYSNSSLFPLPSGKVNKTNAHPLQKKKKRKSKNFTQIFHQGFPPKLSHFFSRKGKKPWEFLKKMLNVFSTNGKFQLFYWFWHTKVGIPPPSFFLSFFTFLEFPFFKIDFKPGIPKLSTKIMLVFFRRRGHLQFLD